MSAKTHAEGKLFEHPNLRRFTALMPVATLFLIFAGALVTSHDAGLSVPDWPTSYGYHMFSFPVSLWIGSIFFEHGHRIIASCVGMLTVVLVFWVSLVETRRAVRILSFTALFAVCLQGVLGGMTVLLGLPASVSVGHALLAQAFLVILVVIAYSQSKEWFSRRDVKASSGEEKFFPLAMGACAVVYTQLFLGAVMRHTGSGLAVLDFPTVGGSLLPGFDAALLAGINSDRALLGMGQVTISQVWIHFAHRVGAVVVTLYLGYLSYRILSVKNLPSRVTNSALSVISLVLLQFALGVYTVLSLRSPWVASLHVVTGALLLVACVLLALRCYPIQSSVERKHES